MDSESSHSPRRITLDNLPRIINENGAPVPIRWDFALYELPLRIHMAKK
ncbi:MAG TPA: hypothetical protein PLL26_03865 [Candidatus Dojkabacteria bacterium]|nr:hypothetical protein [Candidatus Dojkabacteria bacterium]